MNSYKFVMTDLEIVERAYDLFGKGDMDSLRSLMDDEISFITYGDYSHAGSYVGPDEVIEKNFSALAQNIPTLSITPIRLWESEGTIFVRVEATDGDIKSDSIHVWTLEGEKLKTFEAFEDTQTIAKMIKS